MREFSNHAVLSMSDSTMAVSSKYTQDLSVEIVFFTFSCKWFLYFYFWAVIWSYIVDLFAALHELASASARTLLKLASSVRALLKPYGDTLKQKIYNNSVWASEQIPVRVPQWFSQTGFAGFGSTKSTIVYVFSCTISISSPVNCTVYVSLNQGYRCNNR